MTKPFAPVLFAVMLAACQRSEKQQQNPYNNFTKNSLKTALFQTDSDFFDKPIAILVSPSERLMTEKQKELDTATYNTSVDDDVWYQSEAGRYLDSIKAPQASRESEGVLKFKTTTGTVYTMRIDTLFFGVILFNGKNKPISADVTDMGSEYSRYMK